MDEKIVAKFDSLNKSANMIKGGLALTALLITVFLFMISAVWSQVDSLRDIHSTDMRELTKVVNEKLSKNGEDHVALQKDMASVKDTLEKTDQHIIWVQEFLLKEKREK